MGLGLNGLGMEDVVGYGVKGWDRNGVGIGYRV